MYDQKAAFRAQFGTQDMQDKEMHNPDHHIRKFVAAAGDETHRDFLKHDSHPHVQQAVALSTHNPKILDHLLHSTNKYTRINVARNGQAHHHDVLSHDKDVDVRCAVAEHATESSHHGRLIKDHSSLVRGSLAQNPAISDKHLETLKEDESSYVRKHANNTWNNRNDPDGWHADEDHGANH